MNTASDNLLQALASADRLESLPVEELLACTRRFPWFAAPYAMLARQDALQHDGRTGKAAAGAAVRVLERARLKAYVEGLLDQELRAYLGPDLSPHQAPAEPAEQVAEQVQLAAAPAAEPSGPVAAMPDQAEPGPVPASEPVDTPTAGDAAGNPRSFQDWLHWLADRSAPVSERQEAAAPSLPGPNPALPASDQIPGREAVDAGQPEPAAVFSSEPGGADPGLWQAGVPGDDAGALNQMIALQRQRRAQQRSAPAAPPSAEPPSHYTETYAGILESQAKWQEAVAVYEVLALRHPEKSGFFADRIQALQARIGS